MTSLTTYRENKDAFFRSSQSPLTREQRKQYKGLSYFDENPALRVQTTLHKHANPEHVRIMTSTGRVAEYLKYGYAQFEIDRQPQTLQLYKAEDSDELFLAFMDATTGHETYDNGRYLDVHAQNDSLVLDFNLAYNPWCAYSAEWSCPIPAQENRLSVRIEAGEKNFDAE